MTLHTKDAKTITSSRARLAGAMLMVALLLPVTALSQSPSPVGLGTAGNFAVLSKTGISSTGATAIVGDIGVSPISATAITGFGLILDTSGTRSSSALVTGNVYAADYTDPTPTMLTAAVGDMETAYDDASGRTSPDFTELFAGDLTGQTLTPGLYKWGTGVQVTAGGGVTISGSSNDVWIFQVAGTLTIGNGAIVTLSGGAQASNIFWQVADQTTLGTTSDFKGIILCKTLIGVQTGATLVGRALAQTAVTLDANSVTVPSVVTGVGPGSAPGSFTLSQNYPNPFNPSTKIQYSIEKSAQVELKVFNILGSEVATLVNTRQEAGSYTVRLNADGASIRLASGLYFYRLEAGDLHLMRKMVLLK
jgi:hypothetical protein